MFLSFAKFYFYFIQGFSKITAVFILMLKMIGLVVALSYILIKANNNEFVINDLELILFKKTNLTNSKDLAKSKNYISIKIKFSTTKIKITFTQLRQMFIKVLIF